MKRIIVPLMTLALLLTACTSDPSGNKPPDSPSLLFPEHGVTWSGAIILLDWECSDQDGHTLSYDVYFGTDPLLGEDCLVSADLTENEYLAEGLLENTTYYWRIVATDGIDETESAVWSFSSPIQWPHGSTFTDIDGNVYDTIIIETSAGEHEILIGNLRAIHNPATGEPLEYGTDYLFYNDDPANKELYGCMYSYDVAVEIYGDYSSDMHTMHDEDWVTLECCFGLLEDDAFLWGFRGENARIGSVMAGSLDLWQTGALTADPRFFNFSELDVRPGGTHESIGFVDLGYSTEYWAPYSEQDKADIDVVRRFESYSTGICRDTTFTDNEFRYIRLFRDI